MSKQDFSPHNQEKQNEQHHFQSAKAKEKNKKKQTARGGERKSNEKQKKNSETCFKLVQKQIIYEKQNRKLVSNKQAIRAQ